MAIAEPAGPLWTAVKAIYDAWPVDDEAVAGNVAGAWRTGGDALAQGAEETTQAGAASLAAWRDAAGTQFHDRVGTLAANAGGLRQNMANRAAYAEYYGTELASAKSAIVDTIARNEAAYQQLGATAPGQQKAFATEVAVSLQQMIAGKAAALRAYQGESPPVSTVAGGVDRGLSQAELEIARQVFGNSLDLKAVRLTDGGFNDGKARVLDNTIYFPPGELDNTKNARFRGWLVHELTHVWQYQHGANVTDLLPDAVFGNYDYGGTVGLDQGKAFTDFGTEQQADILRDYYRYSTQGLIDSSSSYQKYVDYVRSVPPYEDVLGGSSPF
jgi:hypothetical protein